MIRWAGHVARMGKKIYPFDVWVRKPERKRPLGRSRHRWNNDSNIDFKENGW
jgi:hypothetical protein